MFFDFEIPKVNLISFFLNESFKTLIVLWKEYQMQVLSHFIFSFFCLMSLLRIFKFWHYGSFYIPLNHKWSNFNILEYQVWNLIYCIECLHAILRILFWHSSFIRIICLGRGLVGGGVILRWKLSFFILIGWNHIYIKLIVI